MEKLTKKRQRSGNPVKQKQITRGKCNRSGGWGANPPNSSGREEVKQHAGKNN